MDWLTFSASDVASCNEDIRHLPDHFILVSEIETGVGMPFFVVVFYFLKKYKLQLSKKNLLVRDEQGIMTRSYLFFELT